MKKIIYITVGLCMALAMLTPLSNQYVIKVSAAISDEPVVKCMYFANLNSYPEAPTQIETITQMCEVGGEVAWDQGLIYLENAEGCEISQVSNGLKIQTVSEVSQYIKQMELKCPPEFTELLATLEPSDHVVYINRESYNASIFSALQLVVANGDDKRDYSVGFKNDDCGHEGEDKWRVRAKVGETINVFDDSQGMKETLQEKGWDKSDFVVTTGITGSGTIGALEEVPDAENGTFKVVDFGTTYVCEMKHKKLGINYRIFIMFIVDGPLKEDKITCSPNLKTWLWTFENGNIVINSVDPEEIHPKSGWIGLELPDEAEILWDKSELGFEQCPLVLGETTTKTMYSTYVDAEGKIQSDPYDINITPKKEDGVYRIYFESKYRIDTNRFILVIRMNGVDYKYSYALDGNGQYISDNNNGTGSYHMAANKVIDIFDYMRPTYYRDEEHKKQKNQDLLDGINQGKYIMSTEGFEVKYDENGLFQGKLKIIYPSWRHIFRVYDPSIKSEICSSYFPFCYHARTIMEEGESLSIKELFNGHEWLEPVTMVEATGMEYDDTTKRLKVPSDIGEDTKTQHMLFYSGDTLCGEIAVVICKKGLKQEMVSQSISDMEDNCTLLIDDRKNQEHIMPEEAFQALGDEEDKHVAVIEQSTSGSEVIWNFDGEDIQEEAKDVKLDVEVGDDVSEIVSEDGKDLDVILDSADAEDESLKVKFQKNGKLPGASTIKVYISDEKYIELAANEITGNGKLKLLYFNEETGRFEIEESQVDLLKDYVKDKCFVEFEVKHNSTFVITANEKLINNDYKYNGSIIKPTAKPTINPTIEPKPVQKPQSISVKKIKLVSKRKLKKKKISLQIHAKATSGGKLSYRVIKGKAKYVKVSKTGKVTFAKKCKKGKYKIEIVAEENKEFMKATKIITIVVK